ncbi:MAG: hypothetical protein J0L58_17095 [Burkholderiales bacterium]|nr:hypothetical protein [Burkholderiales bacterium]
MLEFAVVLAVVGALWALLLSRLDDTARLAQRAQLQMAVEQLNLQARLLQLRCGSAAASACWQAWLRERRPVPGQLEQPTVPLTAPTPDIGGLLMVLAQAAGFWDLHHTSDTLWQTEPLPGPRLQVALRARPPCRFVIEVDSGNAVQARPLPGC